MDIRGGAVSRHELISPTAKLIAFLRAFSDIEYAEEMADYVNGLSVAKLLYQDNIELITGFCAPLMEARYKCFDRFIQGHSNFVEIAVGTCVERGHRIAKEKKCYVGTDLPGMIEESISLFSSYYPEMDNHHLVSVNILCQEEIEAAVDLCDGEVMILNEGLWMHLSPEEQCLGASNIRKVLERVGGIWVTPDFDDQEHVQSWLCSLPFELQEAIRKSALAFEDLTKRDAMSYLPADDQELHGFFRRVGLQADQVPLVDSSVHLASIRRLWGNERYPYNNVLQASRLWIITPRE